MRDEPTFCRRPNRTPSSRDAIEPTIADAEIEVAKMFRRFGRRRHFPNKKSGCAAAGFLSVE
jgi:hypothetical protein